jgi:hypothetical protein
MKAREALYTAGAFLLSPILHFERVIRALPLFSFERDTRDELQRDISLWLKTSGWLVALLTSVFLFGGNAVWAYFDGQLFPDANAATLNFFEDWPNMINYTVVCPLYVMLCTCFLVHIRRLRSGLRNAALFETLRMEATPSRVTTQRLVIIGALCLLGSFVSISVFAGELKRYPQLYWFQTLGVGGEKVASAHSFYYVLTNFALNVIVLATLAMHLELFAVAAIVSRRLQQLRDAKGEAATGSGGEAPGGSSDISQWSKDRLVQMFAPFSALYLVSKAIVIVLLVNMYTWKAAQLSFFGLLDMTIVILGLAGAAIVSYPRYHIQYWLFRTWRSYNVYDYPELRGPLVAGLANMADVLILGAAMTNLIAYVMKKSGIVLRFL